MREIPTEGEPYVIIEGGLVQNNPALPVIDLDFIKADFIDANDVSYVQLSVRPLAVKLGLDEIVERIDNWLADHQHLVDEFDKSKEV